MRSFTPNEFLKRIPTVTDGTQPVATYGTTITPGNNTYGSYAQLISGANVTDDVYEIRICLHSGASSGSARDMIFTVGIDPAGGTTYTDTISHLLAPTASALISANNEGGVWYRFPLFIKAGSSIAVKASVNNGTVGTAKAFAFLMCRPTHPESLFIGRFVRTFGATTGSSKGTDVTIGTGSEGAWTSLGTVASGETLWFWQVAVGTNNTALDNNTLFADLGLGDASNKRTPILDQMVHTTTVEQFCAKYTGEYAGAAPGTIVYGRLQAGTATNTAFSMAAYGVGG
jgi:hypothetical protein